MEKQDYIAKYSKIYAPLLAGNAEKAEQLIGRLADVLVMLDECKEHIEAEGCVSEMCQGSYSIMRENPWSRTFDNKSKIMLSLIEKLDRMAEEAPAVEDELMKFIAR